MKNTLKLTVYVVAALSALATVSCSKDKVNVTPVNQKPPVSQDTTTQSFVSYSNDIAPILSLQCVGCHNNLNNHTGVSNWSSKSLTEMKNGNMPPSGQLPTGFIEKFENWIIEGKKNN